MRIKDLNQELDDLLLTIVRTGTIRDGVRPFDPLPLATAWLQGEDGMWLWRNRGFLAEDQTPEARLKRGEQPFSSGNCTLRGDRRTATINMQPPFLSPAVERTHFGSATPMPGFGPLGGHRFTILHEAGHYLLLQMGLGHTTRDSSPGALLRPEAACDGFAVAWAVATGAEPAACVRDTGVYRACSAIHNFAPAYQTFGVLEAAAEIGLQQRKRRSPDPRAILDAVHWACARHLPAREHMDEMAGLSWDEVTARPDCKQLVDTVNGFAARQTPWRKQDEANWWARLCVANPDDAPALRRLPVATFLAVASSEEYLKDTGYPYNAATLLKKLHVAALAGGAERAARLKELMPRVRTRAAFAESLRGAARLFDGELDQRIQSTLVRLATHTEACREEPLPPTERGLPGLDAPPRPHVLIDARDGALTYDRLEALTDHLSGGPVRNIAVIADTPEAADTLARGIRREADLMRAAVHTMTPERLVAKRDSIRSALRDGKMMLVGEAPELGRVAHDLARAAQAAR